MSTLHFFNPENDLALASNMPYFTPPRAALLLRSALAVLPAWWADKGDSIVCSPDDYNWLLTVEKLNGLNLTHFVQDDDKLNTLSPWGWSKYTRQYFSTLGVSPNLLPSDSALESIRRLSHRRLTIEIYHTLSTLNLPYPLPPAPREIRDTATLAKMLDTGESLFVKSPWSGSGRGIIDTSTAPSSQVLRMAEGIIRRQASVLVENALDKVTDFAMLFDIYDGEVIYKGLSIFFNESYSVYSGNIIASENILKYILSRQVSIGDILATRALLQHALKTHIAEHYSGPVGVDMLVYKSKEGVNRIAPCIEVNLRMTMGRVAHELYSRHLPTDFTGVMRLTQSRIVADNNVYMDLVPPGHHFNMNVIRKDL